MVDTLTYVALGASALSLVSLVVLARYYPVLRRASDAYVDSSDVISGIMKELNARASLQDKRLADAQVRLDTLEDRWLRTGWMYSQPPVSYQSLVSSQIPINRESVAGITHRSVAPTWSRVRLKDEDSRNQGSLIVPSRVEAVVLKNLAGRKMTAPEVRGVLGSSREHAARIMKSLADKGFVVRDTSKKPYSYALSDVGRDSVTGNLSNGQ